MSFLTSSRRLIVLTLALVSISLIFGLHWAQARFFPSSAKQAKTGALEAILNPDGSLKAGVKGSFDAAGYRMTLSATGAPLFFACGTAGWDAQFGLPNGADSSVYALAVSGSDLYVGGNFSQAGGNVSTRFAHYVDAPNTSPMLTAVAVNRPSAASPRICKSPLPRMPKMQKSSCKCRSAAFWRYDANPTTVENGVALLHLNGGVYDAAPMQFSTEIQSPIDTIGQRIFVAPLSGDLTGGIADLNATNPTLKTAAGQVGIGLAANEQEKLVSFSTLLSGAA